MRTRQHRLLHLSVFLLIFFLLVVICWADDRARDRASLRGIETIVVKVHTFEREWVAELAKAGLTEAVLQASIERQLEKSGITVVSEEASKKNGNEGVLNVRTSFSTPDPPKKSFIMDDEEKLERFDPKKRYVYAIRLNLRQLATLRRNPEQSVYTITWQTETLGLRRVALIREEIENVVNVFIEAYLSENPNIKKVD